MKAEELHKSYTEQTGLLPLYDDCTPTPAYVLWLEDAYTQSLTVVESLAETYAAQEKPTLTDEEIERRESDENAEEIIWLASQLKSKLTPEQWQGWYLHKRYIAERFKGLRDLALKDKSHKPDHQPPQKVDLHNLKNHIESECETSISFRDMMIIEEVIDYLTKTKEG